MYFVEWQSCTREFEMKISRLIRQIAFFSRSGFEWFIRAILSINQNQQTTGQIYPDNRQPHSAY